MSRIEKKSLRQDQEELLPFDDFLITKACPNDISTTPAHSHQNLYVDIPWVKDDPYQVLGHYI